MLHLHDRAKMAHALTLDLDPTLRLLLTRRIAALASPYGDLTDDTEILIIEPGDIEDDIERHVGFSPLVDPIDGGRFGDPGFQPCWDLLIEDEGWFEMIVTFGSTFAYVLLIADAEGVVPTLRQLCRHYTRPS